MYDMSVQGRRCQLPSEVRTLMIPNFIVALVPNDIDAHVRQTSCMYATLRFRRHKYSVIQLGRSNE